MSELEATSVRLPPDSTGKRSAAAGRLVIDYENEVIGSLPFTIGQTVVGVTSNAQGEIVGTNKVDFAAGEGQLYIDSDGVTNGPFVAGENLQVTGTTYGAVKAGASLNDLYYQKQIIVDKNSPQNSVTIDDQGAMNIGFAAGSPVVSTFGELYTANPENIRHYVNAYSDLSDEFYDETSGSGTITYSNDERSITLDTNFTASGDLARRTSHFYHFYQPGNTLSLNMTAVVGDAGKANVRRRWGLYDADNGVYFELDGTTLYVVTRSKTTGSVVETRVAQSSWNKNNLDGTGKTGFNLDITKANIYFIDVQWLGVGVVRFGAYTDDGDRLVCHEFQNPNANPTSYMSTATLPIRYEVENIDTAVSSSELKVICSSVENIGVIKRQLKSRSALRPDRLLIDSASGEVPVFSIRSQTGLNGYVNRTTAALDNLSIVSDGDADIVYRLRRGSVLQGDSWVPAAVGFSAIECDFSATGQSTTGLNLDSRIISKLDNSLNISFAEDAIDKEDEIGLLLYADGTTAPALTITAEVIDAGVSGNILATMNWKEVWL